MLSKYLQLIGIIAFFAIAAYVIFDQELGINEYKKFTNQVLHSKCSDAINHFNKLVIENDGRLSSIDKFSIQQTLGECSYSSLKKEVVINATKNSKNNPYF